MLQDLKQGLVFKLNSFKACLYTCMTPACPRHGTVCVSVLPVSPPTPDRVSCSLGYLTIYYVVKNNLRTPNPPASASQELRLQECATMSVYILFFEGSKQKDNQARIWSSRESGTVLASQHSQLPDGSQ